jgi:hypothetical protein
MVLREPDDIEQGEEYNIDEVMFSIERGHGNNRRVLYLVKWLDYPERRDWTDEPFDNFSLGGLPHSGNSTNGTLMPHTITGLLPKVRVQ